MNLSDSDTGNVYLIRDSHELNFLNWDSYQPGKLKREFRSPNFLYVGPTTQENAMKVLTYVGSHDAQKWGWKGRFHLFLYEGEIIHVKTKDLKYLKPLY